MHLVYGNAQLTLIAAAGNDSSYGLPGVGTRHRQAQQSACVGDTTFAETFPHPSDTLSASRWATRGWTYQEGLLAKRRLIFTDHQVSFQCMGMHCSEAVYWPYEALHAESSRITPANVPKAPFKLSKNRPSTHGQPHVYFNLMQYIRDYGQKNLTHETDRMDAFRGILADFAERKEPIYHLWGVPVIPCSLGSGVWKLMLDWFHREPRSRLAGFPSWSWTGWSGPVSKPDVWSYYGNNFHTLLQKDDCGNVSELLSLEEFAKNHDKHHIYATASQFLQLQVEMVTIPFTFVRWPEEAKRVPENTRSQKGEDLLKDGLYARMPHQGYTELVYFYADDQNLDLPSLDGKSLLGFITERYVDSPATLIILAERSGYCERLGRLRCRGYGHHDVAYQLEDGSLVKLQPDPRQFIKHPAPEKKWSDNVKRMNITLG